MFRIIAKTIEQDDAVAFFAEAHADGVRRVFEKAEDAENWRGINGLAERVIIKTDVAAGDGDLQRGAGFGDAVNAFTEFPHHFGLFGIAEIQAIGGGKWTRTTARNVARGFGDGGLRAFARIQP